MTKVSIIVPCYNCENTVRHTLDSLAAQTLKDIELIVLNDGSTDHTPEILQDWKDAHPEIRVNLVNKENEGIAATRQMGVSLVTGKYFGFLDSDDYTVPEMFEELYELAEKDQLDVAVSDFYWKNSQGERLEKEGPYGIGPDMMVHLFAVLWNKLYRTDFIRGLDIKFPYGDRYEDSCYLYCMTCHVTKIGFTNKPYVRYVQGHSSITHTSNAQVKNMIHVFHIINEYYRTHGYYDQYHDALEYIHIRYFLGSSFLRSARIPDPDDRRETIMMGWKLLNKEFPDWKRNPYLKSEGGMKNKYFSMVRGWNIMLFAWLFRNFKKDNL
ncbi:MAG: glycosyltransferase [Solobacterium sp.]|nr:glycosyltransferase [Solobacterium sp.]